MKTIHLAITVFAIIVGAGSEAQASSVSYTFTQGGYTDGAGDAGTLTGTFTATPELNGLVQFGDLTGFSAAFRETVDGTPENFLFNEANDFYYDPNTPGSLNFSTGSTASNFVACSGSTDVNAVCEGFTGPLSPRINASGFFEDLPGFGTSLSRQASVVTVVNGPGPATPEPGTSGLFATGIALLIAGSFRRRSMRKEPAK